MFLFENDEFNIEGFFAESINGRKGIISDAVPATMEFLVLDTDMVIDEEKTDMENRDLLDEINNKNESIFVPFAGPFGYEDKGVNGKIYDFSSVECDICLGETDIVGFVIKKENNMFTIKPAIYFMGMCGHGPEVDELKSEVFEYFKDDFKTYLDSFKIN